MTLYVKNMVCDRCIMTVRYQLKKIGIRATEVRLGEVDISDKITQSMINRIDSKLRPFGFEILKEQRQKFIEDVKTHILRLINKDKIEIKTNLSSYLSDKMNKEYSTISSLFSEVEGITVEQYFILQKIEKIKELLVYNELSVSEIAYRLSYSSVAHLSAQFKKITGLSPSHFKTVKEKKRKSLDRVIPDINKTNKNINSKTTNGSNFVSGII
ncbi:MAG: helix-turn-helix transcriptional regulator [Bacteroidetes bacterium]|nr:helix-turn-helix transcriptional regulator [Bacteroidota bacterium]